MQKLAIMRTYLVVFFVNGFSFAIAVFLDSGLNNDFPTTYLLDSRYLFIDTRQCCHVAALCHISINLPHLNGDTQNDSYPDLLCNMQLQRATTKIWKLLLSALQQN